MKIDADIRGLSLERVAHITADVISRFLKQSEDKFVADVTNAGLLSRVEALAVVEDQRQVVFETLRPQFEKVFEELRQEGAGGGQTVGTDRFQSGAVLDLLETSTISGNQ